MSFHGFRGGPERASAISQRALRELSEQGTAAALPGAPTPRVQLTVRVARGASDAAIATRVAEAVRTRLRKGTRS
jgi:hypothetical protein